MGKKDDLLFHCFLAFVAGFLLSYFMNRSSNNIYDLYEGGPGDSWVGSLTTAEVDPSIVTDGVFTLTLTEGASGYNLHVEPPSPLTFKCGWTSLTCKGLKGFKNKVAPFDFPIAELDQPSTKGGVLGSLTATLHDRIIFTPAGEARMEISLTGVGPGPGMTYSTTTTLTRQSRPEDGGGDQTQPGAVLAVVRNFKCPPSEFCSGRGLIQKSTLRDRRPAIFEGSESQDEFENAVTDKNMGVIEQYCCEDNHDPPDYSNLEHCYENRGELIKSCRGNNMVPNSDLIDGWWLAAGTEYSLENCCQPPTRTVVDAGPRTPAVVNIPGGGPSHREKLPDDVVNVATALSDGDVGGAAVAYAGYVTDMTDSALDLLGK